MIQWQMNKPYYRNLVSLELTICLNLINTSVRTQHKLSYMFFFHHMLHFNTRNTYELTVNS